MTTPAPISATTAAATAAAATGASRSTTGLAEDFDSFLKLLTTQLTSQDPLQPMDADQFTQQLVQFTGVEQAIKTNGALDKLLGLLRADQQARAIEYLGAEVEARGQSVHLGASGGARFHYRLEQPAESVSIAIYDERGQRVFAGQGEGGVGNHAVAWNGEDARGRRLPEGLYRLEVQAAAGGTTVPVATTITGTVDGVETRAEDLLLSVDGALVAPDAITRIRRPSTDADAT